MDLALAEFLGVGGLLLRREAREALFVDVDAEGVVGRNQDLEAQILLEAVYEVGVRDLLAHQVVLALVHLALLVDHLDPAPAGTRAGLHDPQGIFVGLFLQRYEAVPVALKQISVGHEGVVLGVLALHAGQVLPHHVLPAQMPAAGEVVYLLLLVEVLDVVLLAQAPQHVPLILLGLFEPGYLQGIHHALLGVAGGRNLLPEVLFAFFGLRNSHGPRGVSRLPTDGRVLEEDCVRASLLGRAQQQ